MAYPNQYQPYQYQYAPQVQPPMDRLAQLQAQQYQLPQMQQAAQPPHTNQGLLWVQGEAGAKAYLMAPDSTVLLMDSEGSRFFLKSTDKAGLPSLRVFEYSEVSQNALQSAQSVQNNLDDKYVTRQEYDALRAKYAEIIEKLDSFHTPVVASEDTRKPATAGNKSRNKGGDSNE